ncbi:helix-turn-helix transcriptional regulator [Phascolarctobacterium faecium]|uniref:helix-turn-helix transcriptional regulator n=2 Tax=Acidaminococcaceae TaxID=909930 RepID=UPI003A849AD3
MYSEINFTKVGINIKMFRAARHITQMELARLLGISQTHLSNIEKGRVQISLRLLVKMANIFNCRLDDFFGMSECLSEPEYESSFSEEDMALIMKLLQMMRKKKSLLLKGTGDGDAEKTFRKSSTVKFTAGECL